MEATLIQIEQALQDFHHYCEIFRAIGVCNNFSLPQQYSLNHYARHIREFGAPNELCSSITKSHHIKAIKQPYRQSSWFEALSQILLINQRNNKLAATCADFRNQRMLAGSLFMRTLTEFTMRVHAKNNNAPARSMSPGVNSAQDDKTDLYDENLLDNP